MGAVDCCCPLFLQDVGSHLCLLSIVLDSNPLWHCLLFLLDLPLAQTPTATPAFSGGSGFGLMTLTVCPPLSGLISDSACNDAGCLGSLTWVFSL